MTSKETAGREGKGADGRARTREVKLAVFFTQDKLDKDGYPVASDIERREPIPRGNVWTHAVQFSALAPAAGVVGIGDVRNMIGEVQLIDNAERTWLRLRPPPAVFAEAPTGRAVACGRLGVFGDQ
ncbi:MAG TPA: hypothetical protein VIV12_29320 [Streptosporangiaceae bacterium]